MHGYEFITWYIRIRTKRKVKIDWKYFATTAGYRSLKAAYIKDVQAIATEKYPMRKKEEFLKKFNWIINRAKHHAYVKGISIWNILDFWEANRDYWWLSYYGNHGNQIRLHSNILMPMSVKGICKHYKKLWHSDPARAKVHVMEAIQEQQKKVSTKVKPRWSNCRKKHAAMYKKVACKKRGP